MIGRRGCIGIREEPPADSVVLRKLEGTISAS
jgi:hypothetical protein